MRIRAEGILHRNQNVSKESTYYQVEHGPRMKENHETFHAITFLIYLESRQGIAIPFEYADKLSPR